jgi:hypothetical protein
MRKWRLRGRRGQVAAVATILGLLLVVTFIANYLTTTLPNQMSVNDLNHVIQVEDQMGRLQAELEAAANQGAVGAQLTQPITLGSSGAPPFAAADLGTIGPANYSTGFTAAYLNYSPPNGGVAGGYSNPALNCPFLASSMTCIGSAVVLYNFTGNPVGGYTLAMAFGGTFNINVTTSGTLATPETVTAALGGGAEHLNLIVLGSNDTVTLAITSGSVVHVTMDGNYDKLDISNTAANRVLALMVGIHDAITVTSNVGAMNLVSTFFGSTSTETLPGVITAGSSFSVYFNSFSSATVQPSCPILSVAPTDSVAGGESGAGSYFVAYNDSTSVSITAPPVWWSYAVLTPSVICPFFYPVYEAQSSAGIDVHLLNTYIPQSDVAFDQGAVVFAQPGGVPIVVDGPDVSANITKAGVLNSMTVLVPQFVGTFGTDSGISTTEISLRLLSLNAVQLNSFNNPVSVTSGLYVFFSVTSSYASGWAAYYNSTTPFQSHWRCLGSTIACSGPYATGLSLGSTVIWFQTTPSITTVNIAMPSYAVSLV